MINISDFQKLDIRIGKIKSIDRIPNADKLLKIIFDIGGEERQILSGIAEFYPEPSLLIGKEVPVILNLEPRKMRGEESFGMMLTADADGRPVLLHPESEVPPGSLVK